MDRLFPEGKLCMTGDRFTRGFFAGLAGGIMMAVMNHISYYLHFAKHRYLDLAGEMLFGHSPKGLIEVLAAQAAHIFMAAILGIIFAYLVRTIGERHLLFKGWVYGLTIWFGVYMIGTLYKVHLVEHQPWQTPVSNVLGSSVYGLILAAVLSWLDRPSLARGQ